MRLIFFSFLFFSVHGVLFLKIVNHPGKVTFEEPCGPLNLKKVINFISFSFLF